MTPNMVMPATIRVMICDACIVIPPSDLEYIKNAGPDQVPAF
jgi:hypothetical protein